jgi:hypothetical protein
MEIIKCVCCKKQKQESEFNYFHGRRNKQCKDCRQYHNNHYAQNMDGKKEKAKIFYQENKKIFRERAFKRNLKSKYSLSAEDYIKMIEQQQNKCLICENEFSKKTFNHPCVDHNHETGKIRGILCRKCNLSISYIENPDFLQKALQYLASQ